MSEKDQPTLDFYAREASAYAGRGQQPLIRWLKPFLAQIPQGGRILELGCGGGQDSAFMLDAGFDVTPTDGSPELAAQAAKRLRRPVETLLFEDIAFDRAFDGVFANACLLHAPRSALPGIMTRIHAALKPGGTLFASFKAGEREGTDGLGRFFNYLDAATLRALMLRDDWETVSISAQVGSGYDGKPTAWLYLLATKRS